MTSISTDRRKRFVPWDGFELLREDLETMVGDDMADTGDGLLDSEAAPTTVNVYGGIVSGLLLTGVGTQTLSISAGVAYTTDEKRIDARSSTVNISNPVTYPAGTYYVDKRISITDDPNSVGTHPFSGAAEYKKQKAIITDRVDSTTGGLDWVGAGWVRLGKIVIDGANIIASIHDYAQATIAGAETLYLWAKTGGSAPLYGYVSRRRFYRFSLAVGAAVSATETRHPWHTDTYYLDVVIPTDSTGTVVATFNDVRTAISATTHFHGFMTTAGASLFPAAGAWYSTAYIQYAGGDEYRKYRVSRVGSDSLRSQVSTETPRFDPATDTMTNHVTRKGSAAMTENNPHGTGMDDIPGLADEMQQHQRREHNRQRSGISKGSDIAWLGLSGAGTNTVTVAAGATTDRAIVNGYPVVGAAAQTFVQAATPAFEPYTSEFVLTQSGAVVKRDIAVWATGAANIAPAASPNEALFSIVAKHPDLTGNDVLTLVSTGVFPLVAYTMTLGTVGVSSGPAVNVTATATEYTIYRKDGLWVRVYHHHHAGFALLAAGTYANTVAFLASEQQDTTLTIGTAAWRNGADGRLWYGLTDTRVYGTMSVEHDAYDQVGDSLDYGVRYSGDTLLAYAPGLPAFIQELRPFEVDYRGRTYRFDSVSIGSIAGVAIDTTPGVHNFLVVRFDAANVPTVTNLGTTIWGSIVKGTDVILGDLVHDALGHPSDTASTFFQITGEKGYVGIHIKVSADSTQGWDIDEALKFLHCVCIDANVKANTVFLLELLSDVATAGGGAAYTVGRLMIKGNGYYITGDTEITVTSILTDNILLSSNFHFVQPAVAVTLASMTRTFTTGSYPDHFLYTAATVASIEAVRCGFGQNGNMATFYSDADAASIIITDSKWYGTTVLTSLVTTNATSAPGHNIKISGCILSSVGTIINLAGRYNTLEMSRNTWSHSATVPPISYSGSAGSLALRLYNNSFAWTSTDPGVSPNFITIADGGAGNFDLSMRLIGNEFNLAYGVGATDPALLRISAGPAAYIGTSGIMFGNNEYRVTALGCTGANQWKCLDDDTGLDLGATYEASNETVYLIGNTDGATHSLGVAGCDSYRVDGLAFVGEDRTRERTRYLTVTGDGCVVDLAHISFPCVKFTIGGDVASKHWVTGTGRTVSIHNIVNAAADSWNAVDAIGTVDDSSLQVRDVSGMVSTAGCLAHITVGAGHLRCNAIVSGSNAYSTDNDANSLVSGMTTPHDASTTGFSVGNTQKRGNPATATGFDVSSNHYVA